MDNVTIIAAIGKNRELGLDNELIWKIPEDLHFFREHTIGKYVLMGMNTLKSLPKNLPNRKYIVLTRQNVCLDSEILVFHSIDNLLEFISKLDEEVMVIGGAQIYAQMIYYTNKMLLTEIDETSEADVYFPKFSLDDWDREIISTHQYNEIKYNHIEYTRKRSKK